MTTEATFFLLEIMEKYRDTLVFLFRVALMGAIALLIAYLMK